MARPHPSEPDAVGPSGWSGDPPRTLAGLAGVLGLALFLRVLHLGHGLPEVLDEDYPLKIALGMWTWGAGGSAGIDWNPHFFTYPSLSIYLHFLVQSAASAIGIATGRYASVADYRLAFETDPTPMVLLARGVGVVCDLVTVLGVARLGERVRRGAGIPAALLVALSPVLIDTSRGIFCDSLLTALSVWSLERMLAWREQGGPGRLVAAVALAGLAAGAKYPGGLLVVPIAWVLIEREGRRALWLAPLAAAASFAVFLVTSPFVLLDFATFRAHFGGQAEHMVLGHFGHLAGASAGIHLATLAGNLGWLGLVALAGSLLLVRRGSGSEGPARVLWAFLVPLALAFGLARTPMERYLSPVIAVGAALAAAAAVAAASAVTERLEAAALLTRAPRWPAALALGGLLLPAGLAGLHTGRSGGEDTQRQAAAWCRVHLGPDALLIQEQYGAPLLNHDRRLVVARSGYFQAASDAAKRRYLVRDEYHVVNLPLFVEGRSLVPIREPSGRTTPVQLFPFASDFCRVYYDPRLFAAADYVLTSGAVRGRFEEDRARFAAQASFYDLLDREAEPVARFESRGETTGPEIRIYRLGPRIRETLRRAGPLPPLWWAEMIPVPYRRAADSLLTAGAARDAGAVRDADGRLAPWVRSLAPTYQRLVTSYGQEMASELGRMGRFEEAERFSHANLAIVPEDRESFRLLVNCVFRREAVPRARATVESTLTSLERDDPRAAALRETFDAMLDELEKTGLE